MPGRSGKGGANRGQIDETLARICRALREDSGIEVIGASRSCAAARLDIHAPGAASMRFRDRGDGTCELVYTYALQLRPRWVAALFGWLGSALFAWEARRRFAAMARFLARIQRRR